MRISRNRSFAIGIAFLVALSALAAVAGCGARPSTTPIAPSAPWIASLLGSGSQFSMIVRPASLTHDPYWGPAMRRALAKPSRGSRADLDDLPNAQVATLFGAAEIEIFVGVRDAGRLASAPREQIGGETLGYVFVARGLAADPLVFMTERGERLFAPPARLPSGALEFPPSPGFAQRRRGLAMWLYVLPDGTWVGVDPLTARNARALYGATAAPPPVMALESDGLFAAFVDQTIIDAATKRAAARDATWRRGLTGAGLVVHGGRNGALEIVLDYTTDDAAEHAKAWTAALLEATCRERELVCLVVKTAIRDVKLAQDGHRFGVTFFLSELLLRKLAEG